MVSVTYVYGGGCYEHQSHPWFVGGGAGASCCCHMCQCPSGGCLAFGLPGVYNRELDPCFVWRTAADSLFDAVGSWYCMPGVSDVFCLWGSMKPLAVDDQGLAGTPGGQSVLHGCNSR